MEAKESALRSTLTDLAGAVVLRLRQCEAVVQNALNSMEAWSMRLGESHTTVRFSLQFEVDRLTDKRDIERLEGAWPSVRTWKAGNRIPETGTTPWINFMLRIETWRLGKQPRHEPI